MKNPTLLATIALCMSVMVGNAPVYAATAHNLQTGAHTKNAYDTAQDAHLKQMHMKKKHHKMM